MFVDSTSPIIAFPPSDNSDTVDAFTKAKQTAKSDLEFLDSLGITYFSCTIKPRLTSDGSFDYDTPGHLRKDYEDHRKYKNRKVTKYYNQRMNATAIPLGAIYNLIGIDVDNKGDTVQKFLDMKKSNLPNTKTLTVKTMNKGYHFYYRLTDTQAACLKAMKFQAKNDVLFGLKIDVKYTNQIFFGPSYMQADTVRRYWIIGRHEPIILPDWIYDELIKNINAPAKKPKRNQLKPTVTSKTTKADVSTNANAHLANVPNKTNATDVVTWSDGEVAMVTSQSLPINHVPNKYQVDAAQDRLKRLRMYLDAVTLERWDRYDDWFKLGAIIYNEYGPFELFDGMSRKSHKYSHEACLVKWEEYQKPSGQPCTIATLITMVKVDSPIEYSKCLERDIESIQRSILKHGITDYTAAKMFYHLNPDKYVYDQINKVFYAINQYNIWLRDVDAVELKSEIATLLPKLEQTYYQVTSSMSDETKKTYAATFAKITKYLNSTHNKESVVKELILFYKRRDLVTLFDNVNDYLFACKNGVIDLVTRKFRLPLPEEYITATSKYDYAECTPEIELVIDEIINFTGEMMPSMEDLEYTFSIIAQSLAGKGGKEEFYVWHGEGGNGKGLLRDLIMGTFGDYFDSMEIEYLIANKHGKHANDADPVMARKKNCRIIITTEPPSDSAFRTEKLKKLSGKDPIQCRYLYCETFEFIPKFRIIIQTNFELDIDVSSQGTIRRLKVQDFPYKFIPNPTRPNEKLINEELKDHITDYKYKIAFLHLLLRYYYKRIDNQGAIVEPARVKQETKNMILANDPVTPFINARIDHSEGCKMKTSDMYIEFKRFHNNNDMGLSIKQFNAALLRQSFTLYKSNGVTTCKDVILCNHDNEETDGDGKDEEVLWVYCNCERVDDQ